MLEGRLAGAACVVPRDPPEPFEGAGMTGDVADPAEAPVGPPGAASPATASSGCRLTMRVRSLARGPEVPGIARANAVTMSDVTTVAARIITSLMRPFNFNGLPLAYVSHRSRVQVNIIARARGVRMRPA